MTSHVQIARVCVSDQNRAKAFYTEKLGFELIEDQLFGDGLRWLSVAPKSAQTRIILLDAVTPASGTGSRDGPR